MNSHSRSLFLLCFLVVSCLVFLSGCIQKGQLSPFISSSQLTSAGIGVPATNKCIAMECDEKNQTFFEKLFTTQWPSLSGGNCSFYQFNSASPTDEANFNALIAAGMSSNGSNTTSYIRPVMIGFGDSLAGADEAQALCNGNLGLAVHDLGGSKTLTPYLPNLPAVNCTLTSNVIPLFKYSIPASFRSNTLLAPSLFGVGPVIVAPGAGYSQSAPSNTYSPSGQFKQIKGSCPNCPLLRL